MKYVSRRIHRIACRIAWKYVIDEVSFGLERLESGSAGRVEFMQIPDDYMKLCFGPLTAEEAEGLPDNGKIELKILLRDALSRQDAIDSRLR